MLNNEATIDNHKEKCFRGESLFGSFGMLLPNRARNKILIFFII